MTTVSNKKKYFNNIGLIWPLSSFFISNCVGESTSSMNSGPSTSGKQQNLRESIFNPAMRGLINGKSKDSFEEIIAWAKNKRYKIQDYQKLIMDTTQTDIDPDLRMKFLGAICAAYPGVLAEFPDEIISRTTDSIINLLLRHKGQDHEYAKYIMQELMKCDPSTIDYHKTNRNGEDMFIIARMSGNQEYLNCFKDSFMDPVNISPCCKSLMDESKQVFYNIVTSFKNQEYFPETRYKVIMDIIHGSTERKAKIKLLGAVCAAYPNCLLTLPKETIYRTTDHIISLLLKHKLMDPEYTIHILNELVKFTVSQINCRKTDQDGRDIYTYAVMSNNQEYLNCLKDTCMDPAKIDNMDEKLKKIIVRFKFSFEQNMLWFQTKKLDAKKQYAYIMDSIRPGIERKYQLNLLSSFLAAYPNSLCTIKNKSNIVHYIISLLLGCEKEDYKQTETGNIIKALRKAGLYTNNCDQRDENGKNLLMLAAASGSKEYTSSFIAPVQDHDDDSDYDDDNPDMGYNPLADYGSRDNNDRNIVFHAIDSGSLDMIDTICKNGYEQLGELIFEIVDKEGYCPITYALAKCLSPKAYPMVCELILDGANVHLALKQAIAFRKQDNSNRILVRLIQILAAMRSNKYKQFYCDAGIEDQYNDVEIDDTSVDCPTYEELSNIAQRYNITIDEKYKE